MGDYLTLAHIGGALSVSNVWKGRMILVNRFGATNSYEVKIEVTETEEGKKETLHVFDIDRKFDFGEYIESSHKDGWVFHFLEFEG
ncbi:hypothetical protein ACQUY5_24260 [Bacillus cereus]|uniref:hypothetical protein n=1 Tax=Bacillus cereus TaxID=1396 RepID=UPI003D169993